MCCPFASCLWEVGFFCTSLLLVTSSDLQETSSDLRENACLDACTSSFPEMTPWPRPRLFAVVSPSSLKGRLQGCRPHSAPRKTNSVESNTVSFLSKENSGTPLCSGFSRNAFLGPPPLSLSSRHNLFQMSQRGECAPWPDPWEGDRPVTCLRDQQGGSFLLCSRFLAPAPPAEAKRLVEISPGSRVSFFHTDDPSRVPNSASLLSGAYFLSWRLLHFFLVTLYLCHCYQQHKLLQSLSFLLTIVYRIITVYRISWCVLITRFLNFFFFPFQLPAANGSSQAWNRIQAVAVSCATALAMQGHGPTVP